MVISFVFLSIVEHNIFFGVNFLCHPWLLNDTPKGHEIVPLMLQTKWENWFYLVVYSLKCYWGSKRLKTQSKQQSTTQRLFDQPINCQSWSFNSAYPVGDSSKRRLLSLRYKNTEERDDETLFKIRAQTDRVLNNCHQTAKWQGQMSSEHQEAGY